MEIYKDIEVEAAMEGGAFYLLCFVRYGGTDWEADGMARAFEEVFEHPKWRMCKTETVNFLF